MILEQAWKFKFPFYVSEASVNFYPVIYSVRFKLFFVSYWFIKWIHGHEKLIEMSAGNYFEREREREIEK